MPTIAEVQFAGVWQVRLRHSIVPVQVVPQLPQFGDWSRSTHALLQHRPARSPPREQVEPSVLAEQVVMAHERWLVLERKTHSVPAPHTPPSAPQRVTHALEEHSGVGHERPQPPHASGSVWVERQVPSQQAPKPASGREQKLPGVHTIVRHWPA